MKKQNLMIIAGAAVLFAFLIKSQKAKAGQPRTYYASNQYQPVWDGLPQDKYLYV